jgi:hypothetical protein
VTAPNQSPPLLPPPPATGRKVPIFLTNGVRTSDGPGPGVKHVPPDEAAALIARHVAVAGDKPPAGYNGAAA